MMRILSTSRGWKTELRKSSQSTSLAKKSYQRWRNFLFQFHFTGERTSPLSVPKNTMLELANRCVDQTLKVAPNRFLCWKDFGNLILALFITPFQATTNYLPTFITSLKRELFQKGKYTQSPKSSFLRSRACSREVYFPKNVFFAFFGPGQRRQRDHTPGSLWTLRWS